MQNDNETLLKLFESGIFTPMMDASNDGFTYTDEAGNIVYWNKTYETLTGISPEVVYQQNIEELNRQGYPISKMMLEVFDTRQAVSRLIKYQLNSERKVMVTVSPVYNKDNKFSGAIAVLRDMTELMHLRQELDVVYLEKDSEQKKQEKEKQKLLGQIYSILHIVEEYDLIGKSHQMQSLAELAYRISHVDSTALITGESGVGKDVFCKMVSRFSGNDTYTKISCGAIPENLLESELFGYEPGAFTGAKKSGKPGIFELAGEGVVFLDEIGEMSMSMQVKLLTVLQDRKFYRIGGVKEIEMKARIIAATNCDLKEEIKKGRFRQDLFYRLNVIPVYIPPLRERKEDIIPIAENVLKRLNQRHETTKVLSNEIQRHLIAYNWPGNIRELSNLIERMYVLSSDEVIGMDVLPEEIVQALGVTRITELKDRDLNLKSVLEEFEAAYLRDHLKEELTLEETSHILGINLSTLVRKINKYNLPKRYKKEK